jgi:L-iditol 2-dehydrogenase
MKAAVYYGQNELRVEDISTPVIGYGEVLVKIEVCGVCGTDLKKIKDGLVTPPRIFGHEMAGAIVEIGEGVMNWKKGDRVAIYHHIPCRNCYFCQVQAYAQCEGYKKTGTMAGYTPAGGGFAEYIRVMDWIVKDGMVRLPEAVSYDMASFLEPVNTCLKCIKKCQIKPGETVLITGQGPIGLLLTQLAVRENARVIVTDMIENRLQKALQYGAYKAIKANDLNIKGLIRELTNNRGVDLAIVATANTQVIQFALDSLRNDGRMMLFAQTKIKDYCQIDLGQICSLEKDIMGSYSSSVELNPEVEDIVFNRKIDVEGLISHHFPIEDIQKAINLSLHPDESSLKILINP